jgi:hypothetical protein
MDGPLYPLWLNSRPLRFAFKGLTEPACTCGALLPKPLKPLKKLESPNKTLKTIKNRKP